MDPQDERELVQALKRGDAAAFERLVRDCGGRMLAIARRLLGSEEDARDAVQEAMTSAFQAIARFEGGSRLSTWLHRIVVNAALMKLRSRKARPERSIESLLPRFLEDGHQANPAVEWRPGSAELAAGREIRELVRQKIAELPESHRNVLMLRDIEELDTQETAEVLGIQPNAVKVRLHRARQALRALLDPYMRMESTC